MVVCAQLFCQYNKQIVVALETVFHWLSKLSVKNTALCVIFSTLFLMFGHPDETVYLVDMLLHDLGALVCRLLGYFIFNYSLKDITYPNNKHLLQNFMTTLIVCFLHSLWATWMCCLLFLKESMFTIPCVLCWCAWQHTSVWVPDVSTVLVFKLLSLKMIYQQSMSVREKILLEEVSCSYSLTQ